MDTYTNRVPSGRIFPCASISASVFRIDVTLCVLISSGLHFNINLKLTGWEFFYLLRLKESYQIIKQILILSRLNQFFYIINFTQTQNWLLWLQFKYTSKTFPLINHHILLNQPYKTTKITLFIMINGIHSLLVMWKRISFLEGCTEPMLVIHVPFSRLNNNQYYCTVLRVFLIAQFIKLRRWHKIIL